MTVLFELDIMYSTIIEPLPSHTTEYFKMLTPPLNWNLKTLPPYIVSISYTFYSRNHLVPLVTKPYHVTYKSWLKPLDENI